MVALWSLITHISISPEVKVQKLLPTGKVKKNLNNIEFFLSNLIIILFLFGGAVSSSL